MTATHTFTPAPLSVLLAQAMDKFMQLDEPTKQVWRDRARAILFYEDSVWVRHETNTRYGDGQPCTCELCTGTPRYDYRRVQLARRVAQANVLDMRVQREVAQ